MGLLIEKIISPKGNIMLKQQQTDTSRELEPRELGLDIYYGLRCVACQLRQMQKLLLSKSNADSAELDRQYPLGLFPEQNGGTK